MLYEAKGTKEYKRPYVLPELRGKNNLSVRKHKILAKTSGVRFTKHLKPKIFVSPIQFVWDLRKS